MSQKIIYYNYDYFLYNYDYFINIFYCSQDYRPLGIFYDVILNIFYYFEYRFNTLNNFNNR